MNAAEARLKTKESELSNIIKKIELEVKNGKFQLTVPRSPVPEHIIEELRNLGYETRSYELIGIFGCSHGCYLEISW